MSSADCHGTPFNCAGKYKAPMSFQDAKDIIYEPAKIPQSFFCFQTRFNKPEIIKCCDFKYHKFTFHLKLKRKIKSRLPSI